MACYSAGTGKHTCMVDMHAAFGGPCEGHGPSVSQSPRSVIFYKKLGGLSIPLLRLALEESLGRGPTL